MTKKSFLAEHRIIISRIIVIPIIILITLLTPVVTKYHLLNSTLELIGNLLIITGVLGRIFASIFMSNNRDQKIVYTGIYSTTRNPLYFFSFVGATGILVAYGSLIFLIAFVIFFSSYYYFVIKAEEKYLTNKFKENYINYIANTPRFFPNFKLFKVESEHINTSYKSILKTIIDSSIILVVAILIIFIKSNSPIKGVFYIW